MEKLTNTPIRQYHQHNLGKFELVEINKFLHQMAMQVTILRDKLKMRKEGKEEIQKQIDNIQHRCVRARNHKLGFGKSTY